MEKITFLSHRQVKYYRLWLLLLIIPGILSILFGIYRSLTQQGLNGGILFGIIVIFQLVRIYRKIKAVEFDSKFLYVYENDYDVVIPLENIKTVDIRNLNGIYRINLHDKIQSGSEIYFKPSLIYPLDFIKQDKKVNVLRSYIGKAKRFVHTFPKNALHS